MPRPVGTFGPMVEHVGNSLRQFLEATGLKPKRLLEELPYSESQMYRHYDSEDLSTAVLRDYESAYAKLGIRMNLMKLLEGVVPELPTNEMREAAPPARIPDPLNDAAVLLRQAAERIEEFREVNPAGSTTVVPEGDRGKGTN